MGVPRLESKAIENDNTTAFKKENGFKVIFLKIKIKNKNNSYFTVFDFFYHKVKGKGNIPFITF